MPRRTIVRLALACFCMIGIVVVATVSRAGVYSGVVASSNAETRRITVKASNGESKSFQVPATVELTIDDRESAFDSVQTGQKVSVFLTRPAM